MTTALAGAVFCPGYLAASFTTNPYLFLAIFGVVTGVGEGLTLMTPLYNVWKAFPHSKGKASGVIMFGYGCGPPIFGLLFTFLVNPQNHPASVHVTNGQASYYLFPRSVADQVPAAMRWMALICAVLFLLAVLLQTDFHVQEEERTTAKEPLSKGLRSWGFWRLLLGLALSRSFGQFLLNVYKALGQKFFSDDHVLSALGSAITVMGALGRLVLPATADYISFRLSMTLSISIQIAASASLWLIASSEVMYGVWLSTCMFVSAGYLPLFAMECSATFGSE